MEFQYIINKLLIYKNIDIKNYALQSLNFNELCLQRWMLQGKTLEPYLLVECCNKYIAPIYVDCNTNMLTNLKVAL